MRETNKILLSLVAVVALAYFSHALFIARMANQDRRVASFGERNSVHQIKWEQKIAQDLSESSSLKVLAQEKLSWQDSLMYEYLHGKYNLVRDQGQIQSIVVQDNQEAQNLNPEIFMKEFAPQFKHFKTFEKVSSVSGRLVYDVKDIAGLRAGSFIFQRNDEGRVLRIDIK